MRKSLLLALMSIIFGTGATFAQAAGENTFEGEVTADIASVQKVKTQVLTKNLLAKIILKRVMKKVENSGYYTGNYTATTIAKGNKTRTFTPYNNMYTIVEKNGNQLKTTTYFPYVKKGYYSNTDMTQNQQQMEMMKKGTVEKTGQTMTILGYKCDVYKVKYEITTDSAGTKSTTNMHCEYAITQDPSLPDHDKEVLPGVKGVPLKFVTNVVSQTSSEKVLNMDVLMYLASVVKDVKKRSVDDSEVTVPSDIKLIDADKDPKNMLKIVEENGKYMKKKGLWKESAPDDVKIYDNLNEDWEY
ncbi:MAG: hypothetical protein E7107_00845 [Prevotella sp.]|jgi:hypothetical protein|nr:hypothetical protein [Prevotella sp.]